MMGIVTIGRNEGDRLAACVESAQDFSGPKVYVDSGSTDQSVQVARSAGFEVVVLDISDGFSAARARNVGAERVIELDAKTELIMFVDGDCTVEPGWPAVAQAFLEEHPRVAVACGRLRERHPERSIYNALCDIEWDTPVGPATACGGNSVVRQAAFQEVGGFNPLVTAGEEPEMCARLRTAGWQIYRLDNDMAWHDAAIERFGSWWKRQMRTGYGALNLEVRFSLGRYRRMLLSAWVWTLGMLPFVAVGAWLLSETRPLEGAIAMGLGLGLPILQLARLSLRQIRRGSRARVALAFGVFTLLGKWAECWGQCCWLLDRARRRRASLIEYK